MAEYSREEVIGHTSVEIKMFRDAVERDKRLKVSQVREGLEEKEQNIQTKTGKLLDARVWTRMVIMNGRPHAISMALDVTEQRKTEEKYKQLLEDMNDGYVVVQEGKIVYANREFGEITGYKPEEVLGRAVGEITWSESRQAVLEMHEKFMRNEVTFVEQYAGMIEKKDGTSIIVETSIKAIEYEGKPAVCAIVRDVTEQRQAEEELRESEERFFTAFHQNPTAMAIMELAGGRYIDVNDSFLRMVEYSREGVIGHTSIDMNLWTEPLKRDQILEAFLDSGGVEEREVILQTKTGKSLITRVWSRKVTIYGESHIISMAVDVTEQRRTEEKYRQLLEEMNDGYAMIQDGKYVFANGRFCDMFGYEPEQIAGKPMEDLLMADERQAAMEDYEKFVSGEGDAPVRYEGRGVRTDGTIFYTDAYIKAIQYEGRPAITVIIRDVTGQKRAEEKHRQLLEDMNDGYAVIQEGKYVFLNGRYAEVLGYRPEQVLGKPITEFMRPDERQTLIEVYEGVKSGGMEPLSRYLVERITEDGTRYIVETSGKNIEYEGRPAQSIVIRDVTGQKQAEEKYRQLLEDMNDGYIVIQEGKIVFANREFGEISGYEPQEVVGRAVGELSLSESRQAVRGMYETYTGSEGASPEQYEGAMIKKDGTQVTVETSIRAIEYEGRPAVCVIVRDITERKNMYEQLMLADRLASIGQLASGIAHELKNPLAGVMGISELLMGKNIPDEIREDLEIIDSEARRAANVVNGLLAFARKKGDEKGLMDISAVIRDVLQLRAYEHRVTNIKVDAQFEPDLPDVIANGAQMQQVFMNLIVNAEQAMLEARDRGNLKVTIEKAGDMVRASISDDGPGISRENMKKLFTPFFTTKDVGKGTGLGLSICHGIVNEHGGRLYAQSKSGKGATFILELPIPAGEGESKKKP
ncbi:PAS domain S-box protein [Chloroflexota bacterium]